MCDTLRSVLAATLAMAAIQMAAPGLARAQEGADDPFAQDTETMAETDLEGAAENPGAPTAVTNQADKKDVVEKAEPAPRGPYPQRFIDRPITLYQNMAEVRVDLPTYPAGEPVSDAALAITGKFAITDEIEVGLRWGAVSFHQQDSDLGFKSNVTAGKALQVDAVYQVFPWLGAQASVPFYLDPFAIGLTLGAPMQGKLGNLRFFGLRDLVQIKLSRFFPLYESPTIDEAMVAIDEVNGVISDGRVSLTGGVAYQVSDALTVLGETGIVFEDFKNSDNDVPLLVSGQYSTSGKLDIGLQVGSRALDDFKETIVLRAYAAFRL